MLVVDRIRAGYGIADDVLNGVSFEVKAGSVVALIGANGAGKTTTMRAVSGMIAPRAGTVTLEGKPISGLDASSGPR